MSSQDIYEEIKKILSEESELKKELDIIEHSFSIKAYNSCNDDFDICVREFRNFLETLICLANLPKTKNKI
ncbi:hypothetical protein LCGC14_1456400 [marine sediment metagenome]|uniref:Uncharacterized protein n=1 Tax=marine sediment metagenome TaxID=412755 RepID=A0A0F9LX15_9ZZZZ